MAHPKYVFYLANERPDAPVAGWYEWLDPDNGNNIKFVSPANYVRIPGEFVRPFRVDAHSIYIFDHDGRVAADLVCGYARPRGWGRIQYLHDGGAQMSAYQQWFRYCQDLAADTSVDALLTIMNKEAP